MKILMLTTNSSLMDGINRHILNISIALNNMENIEVAVCTIFPHGDLNIALEKRQVKTFSLNSNNGHQLKIIPLYYKVIRTFAPDIVHVHVMGIMIRLVSSICFRKIKYIKTIHGIADEVKIISLQKRLEQLINKIFNIHFNALCYVSRGVKDALHNDKIKCKGDVVYNPIKFVNHQPSSSKIHTLLNLNHNTPIIGTSCRIANVKQPELFTEVMCKVLIDNLNVHAVVIGSGDGDLIKKCFDIVEKYGISQRFHWLGHRIDAPQLIAGFNCFVLTSISEGLPTSLLECMTSKTPFAFFEGNGGLKDMVNLNQQFGPMAVVAESGNIENLVSGICKLIENPSIGAKYSEIAYNVGKENFDLDKITKKLKFIYSNSLQ